jgi:hypothetical protein
MRSRTQVLVHALTLALASLALGASTSQALTIVTFEGLAHGRIVDTDFAAQGISQIITTNSNRSFDYGVMFNTTRTGTADPDLEDAWDGGNAAGSALGNILIIQENNTGCGDDVCNNPDDEGNRPAGSFDIRLVSAIAGFGFDLIDVESETLEGGGITFYQGATSVSRTWTQLHAADPTIVWGDNFVNKVGVISAGSLGLTQIDRIVIAMGGSGGIDNLVLDTEFPPVSEPAGASLVGALVAGLAARRARRSAGR